MVKNLWVGLAGVISFVVVGAAVAQEVAYQCPKALQITAAFLDCKAYPCQKIVNGQQYILYRHSIILRSFHGFKRFVGASLGSSKLYCMYSPSNADGWEVRTVKNFASNCYIKGRARQCNFTNNQRNKNCVCFNLFGSPKKCAVICPSN